MHLGGSMHKIEYKDNQITKMWNVYANKRNSGLKKDANKLLDNMIKYINDLDYIEKVEFVNYICNMKFNQDIDITFQQPLISAVIFPALVNSIENKEMPQLRLLYQLNVQDLNCIKEIENKMGNYSPSAILKMANQIMPSDLKTVSLLLEQYFYCFWFGSHHMPEYVLIEEKEVDFIKGEIEGLFSQYKNSGVITDKVLADYRYYTELYNDWFNFHKVKQEITFKEWCNREEKKYSWLKAYYYNK
jgi:hypothetical protein